MDFLLKFSKYLTLLLFPFFICQCENMDEIDFCDPSIDSQEWHSSDAYHLSIREVFDSTSSYHSFKDSIKLPIELYDEVIGLLGAIFDNFNGPERDSIIDIYKLHTFPVYVEGELILGLIKNKEWVQEFINGEVITSNDDIKNKFNELGIEFKFINFESDDIAYVYTTVDSFLNLIPLTKSGGGLKSFSDGILAVSTNSVGSSGFRNDIEMELSQDTSIFQYRSINGKYWSFGVDDNCIPHFIGN